ncbi:hypothetical protein NX059_006807 [Plenodomus lindquistii]|nr:hypothetical protein NX059_006807 [Plenodomus lindquistii]
MTDLTLLPPELLYTILTHLEPAAQPKTPFTHLALSATCKHLHALVEEHANNALKKHGLTLPKRLSKNGTLRRKWLGDICQYCYKASKRRACFYKKVVCCKACDRELFPKMTMTQAITEHHLSKLDLFTPNPLHPLLEELRVGTLASVQATMISEPDVLARRDYIYALLGPAAQDSSALRARPAAHERIIQHLNTAYDPDIRRWCLARPHADMSRQPKSMQTREGRLAYVKKALRKERMTLGLLEEEADENNFIRFGDLGRGEVTEEEV